MLSSLFERRRLPGRADPARTIEDMCTALLTEEGEVSGIRLAQTILDTYEALEREQKRAFFHYLNDRLELDPAEVATLAGAYAKTGTPEDYRALTRASEPRRQELLRRLNQSFGATAALVRMRVDLLEFLREDADLKRTDFDFVHLLRSWFNRGFLVLRQISWETPASILEKIVAYEAVHAINDWDDLRRRLHPPDRRCFAYFHPTMPDEPLIFVEVALTRTIPDSIQAVLSGDRPPSNPEETSVAVFYSISNCQRGLKGISFGNMLIKQVVGELSAELPQLKTFVTLSPIPGLNAWLRAHDGDDTAGAVLSGTARAEDVEHMAARYLLEARTPNGAPLDPVERFHLGNGALVQDVHAGADTSENGLRQSSGAMVNYLYDLAEISQNHETFVRGEALPASRTIRQKAARQKPARQKAADQATARRKDGP
ncbi:malonyl-CoA decarboxylase [Oceanibium sediminis]|uniref:malonyl-CoA decarboxylase n=1 Tax=Oceanibium sediminis TaxID=2026339 RepID=UPI001E65CCC0|nr:malonyl-CoA decarboxylase [Oceanibium sediminis]